MPRWKEVRALAVAYAAAMLFLGGVWHLRASLLGVRPGFEPYLFVALAVLLLAACVVLYRRGAVSAQR